jgi:uncharacterized RDD family membrane protein YckC
MVRDFTSRSAKLSDAPQGPGWWQASDGKWYPPQALTPPPPGAYAQPPGGPYAQPTGQGPYSYQQHGYGYAYGPTFTYSGFWRRVGAALIDGLLLSVPTGIIGAIAGAGQFNAGVSYGYAPGVSALLNLLNTVIGVAYYAILEGTRGQTVGKMAVGIKVVDADTGGFIGIPRGIGRYFARILSAIVLGLGYLWMLWDARKQCWHDKLVRSVVVRTQ